jgi:HPr kinase/phosphorylase
MPGAQAGPEQARLHGVLVDVYGIGVLLQGPSGSGKSECALDLVVRGHRLVADDLILVSRESPRIVIGQGPEEIRHHMEIRGLGVINIRDLFGIAAIRYRKRIELVVMLEPWSPEVEYDRLGVDDQTTELVGVRLPLLRIPVSAGRNMAILVEVAARNHLLKLMGHHAARQFADRLDRGLQQPPPLSATSEEDTE